jgi:DNA polymerase I-like protein with 3'-5' exonuclease and polymerase domains
LWLIRTHELLQEAGVDYYPLGFIHDEQQLSVAPGDAEKAAFCLVAAMKDVQHQLNFKCELDAESVIGNNWAECH